ncbi:recombinase RecT [Janthinobacterium sp. LB2P10]|uniref:recombinase RecT n=1 Tax=Janthinobacterium sp. LB2P10 TaxID=3424194 RepID=UPI003F216B5F
MNAVTTTIEAHQLQSTAGKPSFSLAPQDLAQAIQFADMMSKSSIIPKDFIGNPGNILVAVQWGMELGLQPMQAMQNIAVINGRPSLWGDAVIGLVRSSPLCEYVLEETIDDKAVCRVKRRGEDEQIRIFTIDDAKKAGLHGKSGPWTQYPKRMMQMRARSWALRDVFPDVLRGMPIAEEMMDVEARDINPAPMRPVRQSAAQIAQKAMAPASVMSDDEMAGMLADLECTADSGREALEKAWHGMSDDVRRQIKPHMTALGKRADALASKKEADHA